MSTWAFRVVVGLVLAPALVLGQSVGNTAADPVAQATPAAAPTAVPANATDVPAPDTAAPASVPATPAPAPAIAAPVPLPAPAASTSPGDESYLVQPGDMLTVAVWKEQELQSDVLVRPDGGLSFPLAGEIEAAGHTVQDIRHTLQQRLSKFIPDPVVTVSVKLAAGSRIFVVGKVNRPGDFPLNRPIDVMQALSLAGGTTPFADVNDIRVLRRSGEHQEVYRFRYDDVRRGRALAQNILLHSGDTVVVP
ncbi:MAG: polysaccharide biosynthesis/export family protein [Proteobacteria bacterium]|nr:polysaccharide biosynthesis/export family protein [Pseudomonadota bacterium]